ncbi:MAG: hypothetical protein MJY98_02350 [Fibrobacter sp.]|nr:hypothetical protein [Fibrobacter sp.]
MFFAIMIVGVLRLQQPSAVVTIVPEQEPVNQKAFTGRMVMPSANDIYVLENSANRDIYQIEKYLQGRAAGLHWLAADYFKNVKKSSRKSSKKNSSNPAIAEGDVMMGIKLTLDSLGRFYPEIMFSNVNDEDLKALVIEHIQNFWLYRRSAGGTFEMWAPFVWKSVWNPKDPQ